MSTLAKYVRQKKRWEAIEARRTQDRTEKNLREDLLRFVDQCALCERPIQGDDPMADNYACLVRKIGRLFCRQCTSYAAQLIEITAKEAEPC